MPKNQQDMLWRARLDNKDLKKKLKESGKEAKTFEKKLKSSAKQSGKAIKYLQRELKKAKQAASRFAQKTKELEQKISSLNSRTKKFGAESPKAFGKLKVAALGLISGIVGVTAAFYKLFSAISNGVKQARDVNKAFSEVNTLFDGAGGLTESTKKAIRAQSDLYGTEMTSNIRGYYDIVSSGIVDQKKALEVLNESNKLAKAGLTDIATAADVVTSAMNAYGHETYEVNEITDLLFQTVKKGKTRIPELAQSLGQVIPLASQAGMSFEELSASIATMTAAGVKTPIAITQIKAILNSFIKKEGKEANEILEKLGYNWDIATFKSKGLAVMLGDLLRITKNNEDEMGRLTGNIRSISGLLALSADNGEKFNENLEHMNNAAGATDQALQKVQATISDKHNVALIQAKNRWKDVGDQLQGIPILYQKISKTIAEMVDWTIKATKTTAGFTDWLLTKSAVGKFFGKVGSQLGQGIFDFEQMVRKITGRERKNTGFLGFESLGGKTEQQKSKEEAKGQMEVLKEIAKEAEQEKLKLVRKRGEEEIKLADKIKELWTTTLTKVNDGFAKIKQEAEKSIEKIKATFSGRSFSTLAGARSALQSGGFKARSAFDDFSGQVDVKSLNAGAINQIAQASAKFSELGQQGRSAVEEILNEIKNVKKELTGEDIFGVVDAVTKGFKFDSLGDAVTDLLKKSIEAQIGEVEVQSKIKQQELFVEGLKQFTQAQDKVIQESQKEHQLFKESAEIIKFAGTAMKEASDQFKKPIKIDMKLRGDLEKMIEAQFEKSRQNQTANVNR